MFNIFRCKNKGISKQTVTEIRELQNELQESAKQYEVTRQQLAKNLETINRLMKA